MTQETQIPAGMKMLMKSFGLTPDVLKEMLEGPLKQFAAKVDELQSTMNRVESKLDQTLQGERVYVGDDGILVLPSGSYIVVSLDDSFKRAKLALDMQQERTNGVQQHPDSV